MFSSKFEFIDRLTMAIPKNVVYGLKMAPEVKDPKTRKKLIKWKTTKTSQLE